MTYEEEIIQAISKASKKLRTKVKTIVELNSEFGLTEQRKKIDDIYDSVVGEEIEYFNALLIAVNGVLRKRDTFYLLYSQIYESYDKVVSTLKSIRDLEDKAKLLNGVAKLNEAEADNLFKEINTDNEVCKIEKVPNGTYIVKSVRFKDFMRKEKKEYEKTLSEFKTLWLCLEEYVKVYPVADMIPKEIIDVVEEMKGGLFVSPDLEEVYSNYASMGKGVFAKSNIIIDDILNEKEEAKQNFTPFKSYEEAEPMKNILKYNPFKL